MNVSRDEFDTRVGEAQRAFCKQQGTECVQAPCGVKSGLAVSTRGRKPMNGLRHHQAGDTTGWYIWFGGEFSEAADFFEPIHTAHIYEDYPESVKLLGLPPGYRFVLAVGYLDVWYDASLLNT